MERKEYEMTEEQLATLLEACQPTSCVMIGGYVPPTPQENANDAWRKLGQELGFEWTTVEPVHGKSNKFFTAIPEE